MSPGRSGRRHGLQNSMSTQEVVLTLNSHPLGLILGAELLVDSDGLVLRFMRTKRRAPPAVYLCTHEQRAPGAPGDCLTERKSLSQRAHGRKMGRVAGPPLQTTEAAPARFGVHPQDGGGAGTNSEGRLDDRLTHRPGPGDGLFDGERAARL
jgi:hypothetical protein